MKDFTFELTNTVKTRYSSQFGDLIEADIFVLRDYEPKNEGTQAYVRSLLSDIDLSPTGPGNIQRYERVVSDFLVAVKYSKNGLIGWLGGKDNYIGKPYSYQVMDKVKKALIQHGYIQCVQPSSKRDGLARIYRVDATLDVSSLSFTTHGEGPEVIVKSPKLRVEGGRIVGGCRLARKKFLPDIQPLEQQVKEFSRFLVQHPLRTEDGLEMCHCYRIFNNGSLSCGGRVYGRWQNMPEVERLKMMIDGEPVCEIDIKASYLSIANALLGDGRNLGKDPYMAIPFVRDAPTDERKKKLRKAAKLLVSAYVSKGGGITKFPKGVIKSINGVKRTIPFREEYSLKHNVAFYMGQILTQFPFLKGVHQADFDFMYKEAEIVVSAMDELIRSGVPTYPVHDCLLVRKEDQAIAVTTLQKHMKRVLNHVSEIDISWIDDTGKIVSEYADLMVDYEEAPTQGCSPKSHEVIEYLDDDFDVIEDY